jgi:hypothetical protein
MVDEETLSHLVDAARLSTPELENICQSVLGVSVSSISNASTPAQQARDMVVYAGQYGLLRQVAAAIIERGSDRAGLQNLLLGSESMSTQQDDQRNHGLDIVRLENRVGRLEDRFNELAHQISLMAQRAPLNWTIIIVAIVLAVLAGCGAWLFTVVNHG